MAALKNLFKLSVGAVSVGSLWMISDEKKNNRMVYALSFGSDVFDGDKRTSWDHNWDKRKPIIKKDSSSESDSNDAKVVKPTAKRYLILIRHGQYVHAEKSEDKVLTSLGRRQAVATGERLKTLGIKYDTLHYSTMVRATETANLICESLPGVPTKSTDLLREGAPIVPEPPSRLWRPEHYEFHQDSTRIEAAFRHYFHRASPDQKEDTTEVIVCHANVIRYFVCRALQLPPEAWLRISIANCGITRVTIRPNGGVSLQALGDSGHLPPDMITFN